MTKEKTIIEEKDYSKIIRNNLIVLKKLYEGYIKTLQSTDETAILYASLITYLADDNISEIASGPNYFHAKRLLSVIQVFTDAYRYFSYLNHEGLASSIDKTIFKELSKVNTIEQFQSYLIELITTIANPYTLNMAMRIFEGSFGFAEKSAYEKIFAERLLDDESIEKLAKINPFYMAERKIYIFEITEKFMIRQIRNWQNSFPEDLERSFEEGANFLIDLYNLFDDETSQFVEDLVNKYYDGNNNVSFYEGLKQTLKRMYELSQNPPELRK